MHKNTRHATSMLEKVEEQKEQVKQQKPFTFARYSIAHERHKEHNEDTILVDQRRGLAAVFDGVGGSSAGQVASQIAARTVQQHWKTALQQPKGYSLSTTRLTESITPISTIVEEMLRQAHEQIRHDGEQRMSNGDDQATTVALAAFYKHDETDSYTMVYAYVGDSRVYLLPKDESLLRLTQDDGLLSTLVEMQILNNEDALRIDQATHIEQLSDTELLYFRRRNGITQALVHSQER